MQYTMNAAAWALVGPLQDAIMMLDHNQDLWDLTEHQRAKLAEIIAKYEEVTGIKHLTLDEHREQLLRKEGVEP